MKTSKLKRLMVLGAVCVAFSGPLLAQGAIEVMMEVKKFIVGQFPSDDGRVYAAEFPALTAHMAAKYGKPNEAGTAGSPRLIWAIRVPGDSLGNCVKVDAFKFNLNNPGLEIKVSSGKCAMYEQEKLTIFG
jgi:hypothetical protein